ncbi:MAG TPA: hypothetical protein VGT44_20410 [Ktedonobacteraceae bacterium]|nr:hypothetical protein [Ktedonobacteraceae bacterium]
MVPTLCKSLRKLRIVLIALPLLVLMLSLSPAPPLAHSSIPSQHPRMAMFCLIGGICVDVIINVNV